MTQATQQGTLPDEVVTHALVHDVDLPGGAGRLALVTLDNGRDHTRPSTFGPAGQVDVVHERVRDDLVGQRRLAGPLLGRLRRRYRHAAASLP